MVPNSAVANLKLLDDLEMGSEGDLFASAKMHQTIKGEFFVPSPTNERHHKKTSHNCCVQSYQWIFASLHQSTDLVFRFLVQKSIEMAPSLWPEDSFEVASWLLVFLFYTPKGLERNGRGVPSGTVDPENAMPFEGRQVAEVKIMLSWCWGKMAPIRTRRFESAPSLLINHEGL